MREVEVLHTSVKNAKIGFPTMELEQRIMIGAEMTRQSQFAGDGTIEHPADRWTVDCTWFHCEADNSSDEPVHDDRHSVSLRINDS